MLEPCSEMSLLGLTQIWTKAHGGVSVFGEVGELERIRYIFSSYLTS